MQQEKGMPWSILGSAWLLAFAISTPQFCIPPMEHILKEELLLTHTQTSFLFITPLIMTAALAIPSGILADRIGVRKAAGIGAILVAVGAALRGTTTDFSTLLAFSFIFGAGTALVYPNLPKLISVWFPRERATVATGVYSTALPIGAALPVAITLPLIFPITNNFQGTFFIWSIPAIVAAILWWIVVREPSHGSTQSEPVSGGNVTSRWVLRNKNLWLVGILFLLHMFFFITWAGWTPALMMQKGASPDLAALIASLTIWMGFPAVLLWPRLSHKLGLRKPFLWLPSIILAFTSWWAIYATVPMSWPLMALVGIVHHARLPIFLALPVEIMPKEAVGVASGLTLAMGMLGGLIGALVGGHILDLTGSLDLSLLILIGVSIATAGIAFKLPETGPRANIKK